MATVTRKLQNYKLRTPNDCRYSVNIYILKKLSIL